MSGLIVLKYLLTNTYTQNWYYILVQMVVTIFVRDKYIPQYKCLIASFYVIEALIIW